MSITQLFAHSNQLARIKLGECFSINDLICCAVRAVLSADSVQFAGRWLALPGRLQLRTIWRGGSGYGSAEYIERVS